MVRKLLNGRFENTSFAIFNPTGTRQLTRGSRGPGQSLSDRRGPGGEATDSSVIRKLNQIASQFKPNRTSTAPELQDFNTLRQALNVASADQRLLVVANVDSKTRPQTEKTLKAVFAQDNVVGRFHLNFIDDKQDKDWIKKLDGAKNREGIMIVWSSQFGLDGTVVKQLKPDADMETITESLLEANKKFAAVEKRKDYASHVQQGRRKRIYFENEIPYGEDRDGDGKADQRGGRRR